MSSLESSPSFAKRCNCELVDDAELKKLYLEQADSTDGFWHGPLTIAEWNERFMPSRDATSSKIDFGAVPEYPDAPSIVRSLHIVYMYDSDEHAQADSLLDSATCTNVFPRATHSVHGLDHTTGTFLSPDNEHNAMLVKLKL